jgi:hypothetical protein
MLSVNFARCTCSYLLVKMQFCSPLGSTILLDATGGPDGQLPHNKNNMNSTICYGGDDCVTRERRRRRQATQQHRMSSSWKVSSEYMLMILLLVSSGKYSCTSATGAFEDARVNSAPRSQTRPTNSSLSIILSVICALNSDRGPNLDSRFE